MGNKAINLEIAIAGAEALAPVFTREALPEGWGILQNKLGAFYNNRIRGDRSSNIEKAIAYYHNALQVFTSESDLALWGMIQNNLALVYSERIQGDKAENLEKAIACCLELLPICTRDAEPEQWGRAQYNLGIFYRERVSGDPVENLELSIQFYTEALPIFTREAFPQEWVRIQYGLGISYVNRIKGDRAENVEQAIIYFQAALQVCNPEIFPVDWVKTQLNLSGAYNKRILGDRVDNLESTIKCCEAALQVATMETMPLEWAAVNSNLGVAYSNRRQGNLRANLELAKRCNEAALQVYTLRAYPQNWATLQNNLGNLSGKFGLLAEEIQYLQASLEGCPREAFPKDWADTQYNLGNAYLKRKQIDRAIECFRLSLEIFTPATFPEDCFGSGRVLGDTLFDAGRWAEAIEGYRLAIDAVETSRTWTLSESRRQEILEDAIDVYINMVQVCLNAGEWEKALEYAERSKSKRLADLMASNDLYSGGEISPEVKELLQRFENLQQQIDRERSQNDNGRGTPTRSRAALQARNDTIAALEAQKQQVWKQLRRLDPVLAGEIKVDSPNFAAMQKLIEQPTTAILSFYTTGDHTYISILRQNQISVHCCSRQGEHILPVWIRENWLSPYLPRDGETKEEKEERNTKWKNSMSPFLAELSDRLKLNALIAQHLNGIDELILVPHLLLHLIPFAALPIQDATHSYLGDKFLIRYAPSCQVLEFCKNRGEVKGNLTYGTVEDAEDNLPCAWWEGEQIAELFNIPESQRLIGSSQATRENYRQLAEKVQVLHSCHHAESRLDNPLNSVLKLGDGSITLGQLMTPGWRLPNLSDVFLSCCETGLGVPALTDDIFTLSTGFLCAGARSVISTLWSVDDLGTALFSIFYYQHRQEGKSRVQAFQQAQIKLRELNKEELKELSALAEARQKKAINKLIKYPKDSAERLQWEREYNKYANLTNKIEYVKTSSEEFPFAHPRFWAGFTCSGLR